MPAKRHRASSVVERVCTNKQEVVGSNPARVACKGIFSQTLGKHWVYSAIHTSVYTLKTPRSDLTRKGSHLARPIPGSDWSGIWVKLTRNRVTNVFLTRIPGQSDLVFWSGLTQKWVWHQGTLCGSNLTPGAFRVKGKIKSVVCSDRDHSVPLNKDTIFIW